MRKSLQNLREKYVQFVESQIEVPTLAETAIFTESSIDSFILKVFVFVK